MEEDIEYLEDFTAILSAGTMKLELNEVGQKDLAKKIQNLLNAYKELQKENKTLKDIYLETVIRQNQENKKEAIEYKIYMSKEDNKEE